MGTIGDPDDFNRRYTGVKNGTEVSTTGMEAMIKPVLPGETPHHDSFGQDNEFKNFMMGMISLAGNSGSTN